MDTSSWNSDPPADPPAPAPADPWAPGPADPASTPPSGPWPPAPRWQRRRSGRRRLLVLVGVLGAALIAVSTTLAVTAGPSKAATTTSSTVSTAATSAQAPLPTISTVANSDVQTDLASPAQAVLNKTYTSVVNISVTAYAGRRSATGIGSGVIYTSDGYILTNDHVVTLDGAVTSGQSITVTFSDKSTAQATIVGENAAKDLAVIKVNKTGLTPVTFGSSSAVQLGEWATVIGSPLDYQNSVTLGIVSGLDRSLQISTSQTLTGLMQIDAPISPGDSGGACFNVEGQFIGMPELYLPPGSTGAENIGFAIPADVVASVAHTLSGR
jgi:S1-C subfamily serine protease